MFFSIKNVNGRIILRENKEWAKVGGIVIYLPNIDTKETTKKWKSFVLGGPIFSVLFGFLSLILSWSYSSFFLNIFGYMSIAIGIITLLPTPRSDGRVFMMLYKNDSTAKEYLSNMLIMREFLTSVRPSAWSKQVIDQCSYSLNNTNASDIHINFSLRLPLYYYYYDVGKSLKAVEILSSIKIVDEKTIKNNIQYLIIYGLYITHQYLNNHKLSNEDISIIEQLKEVDQYSYYRTRAAIEAKTQQYNAAFNSLSQAKLIQKSVGDFGYLIVEARLLKIIEEELVRNTNNKTVEI
ncbi:hypothetical protein [Jeotgalibacillus terrae]|uniref:Uncharacterized protein n=1 Tax=Jeotgalibacillus terrae TaxID=587735 RepID=A0ABW5ZJ85_9BACL|nr:hypothetical protein [Jeotgalibacillus terrae]MBM7580800.1 hypothetical protein [Jeotgalibacillus terrae]